LAIECSISPTGRIARRIDPRQTAGVNLSKAQRNKIYHKNLERLVGRELVKSKIAA
jgi:hypothetical protein